MKDIKKIVSVSLLAATALFFGCEKKQIESSSEDYKLTNITFPLKEKLNLKVMTQSSPLAPDNPNDKLIWKRLEEKLNVHIDWTSYTWDTYSERRNLKIASGELPDAFFDAGFSDSDILKYAKDGVILPIEDLIDNYMPNLKAILDKHPEYRSFITAPDGHIYTLPWIEELGAGKESIHSTDTIPWINTTWLDNLDLEMPKTTEEFLNVLKAFKEKDADGDGNPTNEIPMSFIYDQGGEDMKSLLGAFGYGDNWDHTVVRNDGTVIFTLAQDGYKTAVKWLSDMYSEGLIDIDVFSQDWSTYLAKGSDYKYGVYFTWDMGNITGFKAGDYSKPESIVSDYAPMPALEGLNGWKNITRTNGFGLDRGKFAISSTNKNLELTAKWIDQMYEPLQSAQNNWGTYGDDTQENIFELTTKNGYDFLKHLPLDNVSPWELRQKTFVAGPLAILDEYYNKYITKPDDAAWRLNILKDIYVKDMKMNDNYPRVFYKEADQKRIIEIELELIPYATRSIAEMIQTGVTDKKWKEYINQLYDLGLQEWLDIKQEYYDNY